MTTTNISILIVEKAGTLKPLCVKIYNESEIYKRCGFKSNNNFEKRGEWSITRDHTCYTIIAYGKNVGRSGFENNYIFPRPLINTSLFGNCALVLYAQDTINLETIVVKSLTIDFWNSLLTELSTLSSNNTIYTDMNVSNTSVNLIEELTQNNNTNLHDNNTSSDNDSNASELVEEEYLIE